MTQNRPVFFRSAFTMNHIVRIFYIYQGLYPNLPQRRFLLVFHLFQYCEAPNNIPIQYIVQVTGNKSFPI